jgi:hypothetical protein
MSRILLIPVAVVFAAGGVLLGPGESAPAQPAQTSVTPSVDMGVQATNR